MAIEKLALYDLLAPQFLLGFSFPDYIDRNLSILSVEAFHAAYDQELVVYSGVLAVAGEGEGALEFVQEQPSGSSFAWSGNQFPFRLTVSRDASSLINDALDPPSATPGSNDPA